MILQDCLKLWDDSFGVNARYASFVFFQCRSVLFIASVKKASVQLVAKVTFHFVKIEELFGDLPPLDLQLLKVWLLVERSNLLKMLTKIESL